MKMRAVIEVKRVRKLPAPEEPNTVWLPPPRKDPHAAAFPACSDTTKIKNTHTITCSAVRKVIMTRTPAFSLVGRVDEGFSRQ